ncbi:hypothetical protein KVMX100_120695 [Klebsiella variicola]|nr:hypothetical protein KVMX100_120695 [Klebsiella variicola]
MVYVIIQLTNAVPTLSHRTILEKPHPNQVTPRISRHVARGRRTPFFGLRRPEQSSRS